MRYITLSEEEQRLEYLQKRVQIRLFADVVYACCPAKATHNGLCIKAYECTLAYGRQVVQQME